MKNEKTWHPLSNQLEHKQYIKRLNKGFKRCVLCNKAEPELFCIFGTGEKKYCCACSGTVKAYETGFISEKRYLEAIEESKQGAIAFKRKSYY